ncbi:hypothetical protein TIFTF001_016459 [Ficus carica]|uniref:Uncharacterized protein n=1 Tax=Ficus carica TaxID=3494 RepID=A0AA88D8S7_FICCA|nr:hypothetical protein TIFTF001_016459 [Ficus carica]
MPFFLRLCFAASEMIGFLDEDVRITYFGMFCSKYTSNLTYIVTAKEAMSCKCKGLVGDSLQVPLCARTFP